MARPTALARYIASTKRPEKYPLNLATYGPNNGSLRVHRELLVENAPFLFLKRSAVVVLEFKGSNPPDSVNLRTVKDDVELASWIPVPKPDGSTPETAVRCRFIFLQAPNSQARLDVSEAHACKIFTYFQVMPSYVDFISVFAVRPGDEQEITDLRFSSFREQVRLAKAMEILPVAHLGIGGRGYQLSYNLKCVANKAKDGRAAGATVIRENWQWSTRQAAFHHQFDIEKGSSLWILTAARDELQKRIQGLTGQTGRRAVTPSSAQQPAVNSVEDHELQAREEDSDFSTSERSFRASLAVHLLLAQWASEDWRGCIRWLEQILEAKTRLAVIAQTYQPTTADLLFIQAKEDMTNKIVMTLEANANVLKAVVEFYARLMQNEDFPLRESDMCKRTVLDFSIQMRDYIYATEASSKRAQILGKMIADRKSLVQQHLQAKSTYEVMALTKQQQTEAKIMRVIAVVTLVYLPPTFVSTFFSTDVVKYQPDANSIEFSPLAGARIESYSSLALERWFQVTGPLTALTLLLAVGWYYCWEPGKNAVSAWWKGDNLTLPRQREKNYIV